MDAHLLLALFAAAAVNSVIPGPGMVLAIARAASDGFAAGAKVSLGMLLATLLVMCTVWSVLAGLVHLSENALLILRLAGIGVILGFAVSLLAPAPRRQRAPSPGMRRRVLRVAQMGDVTRGVLTGLTSPVHLLFLLALVPQFVDLATATPALLVLITAGILLITAAPMFAVSLIAARSGRLGLHWAMGVRRLGGVLLLGFVGLALAAPTP
jgi:threonine/homoserine/homoserine lactone efflux protein